jgi:predicted  nucleic acid-binding Zn-ribbon protein
MSEQNIAHQQHTPPADQSRVAVRDAVRALEKEIREIGEQIKDCELAASRETNEARVIELLAERSRLAQRKEALPFLLRGTQARALHAQADALFEEASAVKVDFDGAHATLEAATERIADLKRQTEQADKDLIAATVRHGQLERQYWDLQNSAGYAKGDANCIERGEPMSHEPNRFDEPA